MRLTDLSTIREIMSRHGISFFKKSSQSFLINSQTPAVMLRG